MKELPIGAGVGVKGGKRIVGEAGKGEEILSTVDVKRGLKVGKDDVGKVIGKQGRVANAIRTVAKASGAKAGVRIMVNVFNKPME